MKKNIFSILKMIITTVLIFITPFILPILTKLLLILKVFDSLEEFKEVIQIYYNLYPAFYIIIGIIILLWFFHKWGDIKEAISNRDWSVEFGDKKISTKHKANQEIEESAKQKEFVQQISEISINNDSENTIKEIKEEFGNSKKKASQKCKECNKEEIENENSKLRYFAAYNMINTDAKSILHVIYNERYMPKENFKSRMIQGYKKRNRKNQKLNHKDINKIANNKFETIYQGLKFLNIIEPSEDDSIIRLTKTGMKFVEEYIERGD